MKKWVGAVLAASIFMTGATMNASADVKYSPQTVKKLASQGKLPKTPGKVGMTYGTLKKTVAGHLSMGEPGVMYFAKNSTTVYLFPKDSISAVKNTTKVIVIDRTFKQTSFTTPLTSSVMQKNFNGKTWIGFDDGYYSAYRAAYKTNSNKYLMYKSRNDGTVTLTVGTKKNLYRSGFYLNS